MSSAKNNLTSLFFVPQKRKGLSLRTSKGRLFHDKLLFFFSALKATREKRRRRKSHLCLPCQNKSSNNVLKYHTKTTTQNHHHHHHVWCIVVVVVVGTAAPGAPLRGDRDDGRDDQRVRVVAVRVGRRVGDFETFEKENDGETLGG